MTEHSTLSNSDAVPRWASLRRHQIALILVAAGALAMRLLVAPDARWLFVTICCVGLCVVIPSSSTVGEVVWTACRFAVRPRWSHCLPSEHKGAHSPGTTLELDQAGRLDLSGRDAVVTNQIRDVMSTMTTRGSGGHVCLQIEVASQVRTLLTASGISELPGWQPANFGSPFGDLTARWAMRESWRTVRTSFGVVTTLRVDAFAVQQHRSLLEVLQNSPVASVVYVHGHVVPAAVAVRLTGRAVHRQGGDAVAASALGFRRSAQGDRRLERLIERERLVAAGTPLVQLSVYVTIVGTTGAEVAANVATFVANVHQSGMRLSQGRGQQARWFRFAVMTGGPAR